MPDRSTLLYLEPDDEITSVVRRLRETDAERVVLVASGRSKATTSAVALRLLAGVAAEEGREIALVADAGGRALAAEAGIAAFAAVADATADDAVPAEPPPARRAPIRIVRGEEARVTPLVQPAMPAPAPARSAGPGDETMAVPAVAAQSAPSRASRPRAGRAPVARSARRGVSTRLALAGLAAVLLVAVGLLAVVAPAASVVIRPTRVPIEPVTYTLSLPIGETEEGEVQAEAGGTATGTHRERTAAFGEVTFANWNTSSVRVEAGTRVAGGAVVFVTSETIIVDTGFFGIPGTARVGVAAVEPGPDGNLPADAIDTVLDEAVRNALRAFSDNPNRIVRNENDTTGGTETEEPEVTEQDVTRARRAVRDDLARQVAAALEDDPARIYAAVEEDRPQITVPDDLVGRRGEETFTLSGTLAYRRASVSRADVEAAAVERLLGDDAAVPVGRSIAPDTAEVEVLEVAVDGDALEIQVRVTGEADPAVDAEAVLERIRGLTELEAEAALASLGDVDVALWPGWVDRVPELAWRIEVRVEDGGS